MLEDLRKEVCDANLELWRSGLVRLTFGNVSGIDRALKLVVIKPSGVPYDKLKPKDLVAVSLDGRIVQGDLNPSSDTPTHLELYRRFPKLGGVTHAHSVHASAFAQACREIPCLGTTHADYFRGTVPCTRALTAEEVAEDYTGNTGKVIAECLGDDAPLDMPGILVAHHGPFAWGRSPLHSVENAVALETVAEMALGTFQLVGAMVPIPEHIRNKHYNRKHGPNATYGQSKRG